MLGIDDPWIWSAYVLCLASTILCVIYGVINWNRGDDAVVGDDMRWAAREAESAREE